jgi:predicted DNA-binding protein (MmcQ/YjbR family)
MEDFAHASSEYLEALERLRAECADWPGVTETTGWGNPTFKANGTTFAVLDRYSGSYCVWLRCGSERRRALVEREGYFPAPYDRQKQAVCRRLEGLDWGEFRGVLRASYESLMPG